ncbi:protein still life, isoform SIF type 1-like isoform X2 [Panonychus citri]|uniref:protein still life, isoform SIF type 1-like isoform X2 n=1 Tax=Panonychus citri TaxID=50023 RepID=UPI002307FE93|nr:protein still life, isoform SIF type 1-like isoform X2 [Panonychus citri]
MGNKLSCSCAPLIKKAYQYEEQPYQQQRRRDGHLLRLWAEVFHVSAASGAIRWQQVTSDLVPVNITCIQDSPECIFQITAYNSQVEKILDVRLAQPGTRLGQASECFVYWKDVGTGDTWGLNFTSSDDAKQFRLLCSPSFKISRKASSSYSLRLNEPPSKRGAGGTATGPADKSLSAGKRKPQSTPSSPSRRGYNTSELQCTCMAADTLHKQRNGRVRYTGSSTMPKSAFRHDATGLTTYPSTTSVHAAATAAGQQGRPVSSGGSRPASAGQQHPQHHQQQQQHPSSGATSTTLTSGRSHHLAQTADGRSIPHSQQQQQQQHHQQPHHHPQHPQQHSSSSQLAHQHHPQQQQQQQQHTSSIPNNRNAQYSRAQYASSVRKEQTRSMDSTLYQYHDRSGGVGGGHPNDGMMNMGHLRSNHHPMDTHGGLRSAESGSMGHMTGNGHESGGTKMSSTGVNTITTSTSTSVGGGSGRREINLLQRTLTRPNSVPAWNYSDDGITLMGGVMGQHGTMRLSRREDALERSRAYRSEVSRRRSLERTQCVDYTDQSPPSDHYLSDNAVRCYATTPTPSSSGDEGSASVRKLLAKVDAVTREVAASGGDMTVGGKRPSSPTIKLLQEYETHLRNALAKGCDADTYSLNTFENILSQSMENVVSLMREVQNELDAIRREEQQYRSTEDPTAFIAPHSTPTSSGPHHAPLFGSMGGSHHSLHHAHHHHNQHLSHHHSSSSIHQLASASTHHQPNQFPSRSSSLVNKPYWTRSYTLPSRGTSLPPPSLQGSSASDLCSVLKKSSVPHLLDTLSADAIGRPGGLFPGSMVAQASFESTDSKAYLTSSEMSDDERLSLTTAISDDDDGELRNSPYRAKSGAAAAAFQCTGAVRKAGFLSVKKWLLRKRHQVELARKRGWKGYWVCLKGTTILFYPCDSRDGRAIESKPRHLIIIDGSIMQPIPEHPKRDFVFCLSTAFGDAYLFQAPCQMELDNWIDAIHNACGSAFARHRGKTGTLHLLQEEVHRIDRSIEADAKLKHLAELQLTVVADPDSRKQLTDSIRSNDESLESYHCEQFRLRCYLSSIQGTELPNPKTLLAHVSKPTKSILNRLGVFTVSSFHAYLCARSPSTLKNIISSRGSTRRRGVSSSSPAPTSAMASGAISASTRSLSRHSSGSKIAASSGLSRSAELPSDKLVQMILPPDDSIHTVHVRGTETVEDLLWLVFTEKQMSPNDYFIRCKRLNGEHYIPSRHEVVDHLPPFEVMEVAAKVLYQVELSRHSLDQLFGFSVEAELVENSIDPHNQDELCVFVSRVEESSLAANQGLKKGDEIMVINGAIVSDLDMMYIESVLQEELSLCMMLRSCRTEPPDPGSAIRSTDDFIESLMCPPPPSDGHMSDEMIGKLIVPSPLWVQERSRSGSIPSSSGNLPTGSMSGNSTGLSNTGTSGGGGGVSTLTTIAPPMNTCLPLQVTGEQIAESLLKSAEQVTSELCRVTGGTNTNASGISTKGSTADQGTSGYAASGSGGPVAVYPPQYVTTSKSATQHIHTSQLQYHKPLVNNSISLSSTSGQTASRSTDDPENVNNQGYIKRPPLSDAEKLRKVIKELVDTEKTYVEHLNNLLDTYLEPMKRQNLVSNGDISLLFGNIQEIVNFQRAFLDSLEEAIKLDYSFDSYNQPPQFRNILFSIGNSFLLYADKFKLYSSFCASHSKASKILHPSSEAAQNPALIEFLHTTSRGQHANSLESYLIKPIQRILKYPLLLSQCKSLTDPTSDEHKHLSQALKGMERVAEHINEMQRIHEEYGAIFDHLQRQHLKSLKISIELSPGELLYYGGVEWVNISEFLGKIKKGLDLHSMCFVFKSAVVFLCKERIRQKKKLVSVSSKISEVEIIRYQVLIPVTEVQVRATSTKLEDKNSSNANNSSNQISTLPGAGINADTTGASSSTSGSQYLWELIHLRCSQIGVSTQRRTEKVYQLSNSTNEFRNAFLRTIRQIIRESVRKMAVPVTKPALTSKSAFQESSNPVNHHYVKDKPSQQSNSESQGTKPIPNSTTTTAETHHHSLSRSSSITATPSSGGAIGSNQQTTKPTIKQKPAPPPRAPTTTKSTGGPTTAQQQAAMKEKMEREHNHHHHHHHHSSSSSSGSKQTVSCGLCGADVGLGPNDGSNKISSKTDKHQQGTSSSTDKSDPSSSSGKGGVGGRNKDELKDVASSSSHEDNHDKLNQRRSSKQ